MAGFAEYFAQNGGAYLAAVGQHLGVSLLALALAAAVAVPLGVVCAGSRRLYRLATGVFSTLRIVPSLAVLFLCIPVLGVGVKTALVALTVLAIPPVLINTAQGFKGLPADVLEAGTAMGMAQSRLFWTVKLPLAAPLILAGLRTATVEVISSATLAAYIGAGGLGTIIFTGIGLFRTDLLFIGGASVALLSVGAAGLWGAAERYFSRWAAPAKT